MIRRVLLINPYYPAGGNEGWSADGEHLFDTDQIAGHLGLGYLASVLRDAGLDAEVIDADLLRLPPQEVCERAAVFRADMFGVTTTHDTYLVARAMTDALRGCFPAVPIVVGGPLARVAGARMEGLFPAADAFVLGEGEQSILDVVQQFDGQDTRGGRKLRLVGHSGKFFKSSVLDPNLISFPVRADQRVAMDRQTALGLPTSVNILSSRGCPAACAFCTIADYGRVNPDEMSWRPRDAINVVDEMERLQTEYAPQCQFFMDDVFLCGARGRRRAHEIASEIVKRRLRVNFAFSCRASDVEVEALRPLKEAGLYHLSFGIETIDTGSLKLLNKKIRLETFERAFDAVTELDISISTYMMLYHPYTSLREIAQNYHFLRAIGALEYTVSPDRKAFELLFQCKTTVRKFGGLEKELGERGLLTHRSLSDSLPLLADYEFADTEVTQFLHALHARLRSSTKTDVLMLFEHTLSQFYPEGAVP